ncbi:putative uncharacterized protein DDB_G0275629 isoform X1 [Homalodisca vitripennis]|uniref:putative uncharacterized protein DDB_G0275629 isoform X1 n=1 Tax=Homalodisca vitripennis TaxID=197043 RepID=UPI001EEA2E4C|nr:putative uncharacterized protein DDB_G0275629 isoform X1 [Homalodisca vitripennis]
MASLRIIAVFLALLGSFVSFVSSNAVDQTTTTTTTTSATTTTTTTTDATCAAYGEKCLPGGLSCCNPCVCCRC